MLPIQPQFLPPPPNKPEKDEELRRRRKLENELEDLRHLASDNKEAIRALNFSMRTGDAILLGRISHLMEEEQKEEVEL